MKLWIDTSAVARAEALFGLPPLERLRRSAAKASEGAQVVLSGPGATPAGWPGAEVDADAAPLGARLRRALARRRRPRRHRRLPTSSIRA